MFAENARRVQTAGGGDDAPVALLHVANVHAAYSKKEILHGISLVVRRGEVVALFGGNGSGKSTLLKTIAGLLLPTDGHVHFAGRDVTLLEPAKRQQAGLGYLLQGARVFQSLTVAENIDMALRYGHGVERSWDEVPPPLREALHTRAGLLSGGQRQLLALEMVLAQCPKLLLLDEPTATLSTEMKRLVIERFAAMARQGCGVLLVEQNTEDALRISDRVVRLGGGFLIDGVPDTSGDETAET